MNPDLASRELAETAEATLCCPKCREPLRQVADSLACERCGSTYPIVLGIPDLRIGDDPYLSRDDDRRAAERLDAAGGDFASRLASYYERNEKVGPAQMRLFMNGVLAAEERAAMNVAIWNTTDAPAGGVAPKSDLLLDIGCGTAPLSVACLRRGCAGGAVAVDVGMRWLVLARARSAEAGVEPRFVCANAESLPFHNHSFDRVAGESIVEVVQDQSKAVTELARVLKPGGGLLLTTPNRRSLGPDPHTGRLAGGWFSEGNTATWAMRRSIVPPRRTLLSADELRASLANARFEAIHITVPRIGATRQRGLSPVFRAAVAVYHLARRTALGRAMLRAIGPTLVATAVARTRPRQP